MDMALITLEEKGGCDLGVIPYIFDLFLLYGSCYMIRASAVMHRVRTNVQYIILGSYIRRANARHFGQMSDGKLSSTAPQANIATPVTEGCID